MCSSGLAEAKKEILTLECFPCGERQAVGLRFAFLDSPFFILIRPIANATSTGSRTT
jgi:hypothetical protein